MTYKRKIKFQYFQVLCKKYDVTKKKWNDLEVFDLVNWIQKIDSEKLLRKKIEMNGYDCRIDEIKFDIPSKLWAIRVMKLRDTNIPSKVKENEEAEIIPLDDDEYLGEDVSILYDKKSGILMMQSNRSSLNRNRLQELIEFVNGDNLTNIYIRPIIELYNQDRLKNNKYKSIDIAFANLSTWNNKATGKEALASIINPMKNLGGIVGHVTISLGRTKTDTLNKTEINTLIDQIRDNDKYINSAKLKIREDDDSDTDIIDLFDNLYHDFIEFSLEKRQILDFEKVITAMINKYQKRKTELYNSINYKME